MKKSFLSKFLAFFFLCSLVVPVAVSVQSCGAGYKTRNGGKRINSSGRVGHKKSKNRHVWGK